MLYSRVSQPGGIIQNRLYITAPEEGLHNFETLLYLCDAIGFRIKSLGHTDPVLVTYFPNGWSIQIATLMITGAPLSIQTYICYVRGWKIL